MTDIDDLLRDDATSWRADEAPFPSLEQAVARTVRVPRRGRVWMAAGAAAAVVALTSGAVAIVAHRSSPAPEQTATAGRRHLSPSGPPPASIDVDGRSLRYLGTVPWAGAVLDPSDARVVYVEADGDALNSAHFCGVPAERVYVSVTARTVKILVAGYGTPVAGTVSCASVAHRPQRTRVELAEPLDGRTVIDSSDGRTHVVLDASSVPSVTSLPPGCAAAPLLWSEQLQIATRECRGTTSVLLDDGPVGAYATDRGTPTGARYGPYPVASVSAFVWRDASNDPDIDNVRWIVQWTQRGGRQLTLTIDTTRTSGLTRERVLAIARSVR